MGDIQYDAPKAIFDYDNRIRVSDDRQYSDVLPNPNAMSDCALYHLLLTRLFHLDFAPNSC